MNLTVKWSDGDVIHGGPGGGLGGAGHHPAGADHGGHGTMATKGGMVVNNSVVDPESGGTEVPGHL